MNGMVYVAKCTANGKVYVGQTINGLALRRRQHFLCKPTYPFAVALHEFGIENFTWECLHEGVQTLDELNRLESESIELLNARDEDYGYNCNSGRCVEFGSAKLTGPVPPLGGRVRITINLPAEDLDFVESLPGRSLSDKLCGLIRRFGRR